jgi:outer membrane immunogenic protein
MKPGIFAVAAIIASALPVVAADIPIGTPARAPAVYSPVYAFNWSGFYIGAMGGYAKGAGDFDDMSGGFAGGTIGFNFQGAGSPFVFGIEADGAWTNFGDSITATVGPVVVTASTEAQALATVRAASATRLIGR